jgi:hypothetical protein
VLVSTRTQGCVRADALMSPQTRSCVQVDTSASVPPCPSPFPPYPLARLALRGRADASMRTQCRRSKIKIKKIKFGSCLLEKKGKKCSVFSFQSPSSPSSTGFAGEAARRKSFFRPSSPSHPSKLYSSLGWLNSKVPKPFFPFIPRLIDVDGF